MAYKATADIKGQEPGDEEVSTGGSDSPPLKIKSLSEVYDACPGLDYHTSCQFSLSVTDPVTYDEAVAYLASRVRIPHSSRRSPKKLKFGL
ncbi:hypothetical protein QVD17_19700 [Tagetes erecta]|uniref:Uncharacterized protein n=1 Tax=Tagetes erecta TaxID=13708 RepID=A0AAD8KN60_TARER|nr:hypothetical protein QVD17_19700 [Tagetes erecta]